MRTAKAKCIGGNVSALSRLRSPLTHLAERDYRIVDPSSPEFSDAEII